MVKLPKIKRNDFFQRDSIPILVSHALCLITRKLKLLYFEMTDASGLETCTKIYFLVIFNLVQKGIRKNLAFLTMQSDDVTVKTIN